MSRNMPGSSPEGFYTGSPILTEHDVRYAYAKWNVGMVLHSGLVAIGCIALSPEEEVAMRSGDMFNIDYGIVPDDHPLSTQFQASRGMFAAILGQDIRRGELPGAVELRTYAGFYRGSSPSSDVPVQRTHPHTNASDESPLIEVHYAAVFSDDRRSLPVSYDGGISRADIVTDGPLSGELMDRGGSFTRRRFPSGTVLRYVISAHGSGDGMATRMAHAATLTLPQLPHPIE